MKKRIVQKVLVITLSAMLCLSGCGSKAAGSAKQAGSEESGSMQAADENTADPAADAAAEDPVEETPAEEEDVAKEIPAYQIDRSGISDEVAVPVVNRKTNATLSYEDILDEVEQQTNAYLAEQAGAGQQTDAEADGEADKMCVNLTDYQMDLAQIKDLSTRFQEGGIAWKLDVDGVEIASDAKEIDLSGHDLSAQNVDMYALLGMLNDLEKIDMCQCGYSNEEMAALQDTFPDIKIVWEIVWSHWTLRTDVIAFSTMKTCSQTFFLQNEEAKYLKYCTDLVALDLGHNYVTDISFLQYMPNLKILILVDNVKGWDDGKIHRIDDLSMLQYVPKLQYLEFFCDSVSDISFLQYTPDLVDLNISYNPISDATYLFQLPKLERLFLEHTRIPYSEFERLQETYPNAQLEYYGQGSIDHGWRTHERYYAMRDMFKNNYVHPLFAD